jgi:ABC-type branched-subunit amino acid transport system ATPase component/branched-subunit amino acid ABC-type transport system permease component
MEVLLFALLGLGLGGAYALMAQGVLVMYQGSGTINFAQGAIAMVASYFAFWELQGRVPVAAAMALGVLFGAVLGVLQYLLVMRWVRRASQISRLVATLGVMLLLEALATLRYGDSIVLIQSPFPQTPLELAHGLAISPDSLILFLVAVVISLALATVYRRTIFGQATTAVAENELASAALGWSPDRIAMANWALGGALAGLAGVLIAPIAGLSVETLVLLIVVTVAAALVGRFQSFLLTLGGGLVIGIAQSEISRYVTAPGAATAAPLIVVVVALVITGHSLPVRGFVSARLPRVGSGRTSPAVALGLVVIAVVAIWTTPVNWVTAITTSLLMALLLLSLVVLTGYAGQVSLANGALAGGGAFVAGRIVATTGIPFELATICALLVAVPVGILFALPAVRTRGTTLAVVTLSLGVALNAFVFSNTSWTGGLAGTNVGSLHVFGVNVDAVAHPARFATLVLIVVLLGAGFLSVLRRSALGYRMLAVRENERAATALGVDVARTKITAFAISSGIAAIAGVLMGFRSDDIQFSTFDVFLSLLAVAYVIIGGIGLIGGALIGSILADGGLGTQVINSIGSFGEYLDLIAAVLLIVNVVGAGDGVAATFRIPKKLARFLRQWPPGLRLEPVRGTLRPHAADGASDEALSVAGIHLSYGGVHALRDVSLSVQRGEIVGLIGPNGAGKTSLLDAISGLAPPQRGTIALARADVTRRSATRRARLGLGRTFQAAELFGDLTVAENLTCSAWAGGAAVLWSSLFRTSSCQVSPASMDCLERIDVAGVEGVYPKSLSLGQRRFAALARALAGDPLVVMLDEPAAGLDDTELDSLGRLLRRLAEKHGLAILLVEHHVGLIMAVSDRVYVLESGAIIASGTPAEVASDPRVVAAYLGDEFELETGADDVTAERMRS